VFCIDPIFGGVVGRTDKGRTDEGAIGATNGWVIMIGCVGPGKADFPPRRCEL
jgi:hypothetical protein